MAFMSTFRQRLGQIGQAFNQTREVDSRLVPWVAGVGLGILALCMLLGVLLVRPVMGTVLGVLLGALGAMSVFGRRMQRAQYAALDGQPGAAAAVLQSLRGNWRVTPAVAFTRKQDFVHRVVGRAGVIVVGEGSRARVAQLLKQEHRRISRAAGDAPVHEVSVGDTDGQVPLSKLQSHVTKLPRKLKRGAVDDLETRLSALRDQNLPIPKGPIPYTKKRR
jgi:hypothetical protein